MIPARTWLAVSVHDVAPATRQATAEWIADLAPLGVRASLLVVPGPWRWPGLADDPGFAGLLRAWASDGHEVAQHGWEHRATKAGGIGRRLVGQAVARGCAEFWALDEAEARRRLLLGRSVLDGIGLPPRGFTPPGWLASAAAMRAMASLGYRYTTTHASVVDLASGATHRAVALSHRPGGTLERPGSLLLSATARLLAAQGRPVRIALHPDDLARPGLREATLGAIEAAIGAGERPVTYSEVLDGVPV